MTGSESERIKLVLDLDHTLIQSQIRQPQPGDPDVIHLTVNKDVV